MDWNSSAVWNWLWRGRIVCTVRTSSHHHLLDCFSYHIWILRVLVIRSFSQSNIKESSPKFNPNLIFFFVHCRYSYAEILRMKRRVVSRRRSPEYIRISAWDTFQCVICLFTKRQPKLNIKDWRAWILKHQKKIERDSSYSGHCNFSLCSGTSHLPPFHPPVTNQIRFFWPWFWESGPWRWGAW